MKYTPSRYSSAVLIVLGCLSGYVWTPAISLAQNADDDGTAPAWAQQRLPDWIQPSLLGKHGLHEPWCSRRGPLGQAVAGIDRWQANHFIVYRQEAAGFLYGEYTPTRVEYRQSLFPALERIVAKYTTADQSDCQKAVALLTTALPQQIALQLAWEDTLDSQPVALRELRVTLAPYEQRTELLPRGFQGKDNFAWGPFDAHRRGLALDNAGYLPDGTQYQEFLYASISREYNRFTRGTQPLQMSAADYVAAQLRV